MSTPLYVFVMIIGLLSMIFSVYTNPLIYWKRNKDKLIDHKAFKIFKIIMHGISYFGIFYTSFVSAAEYEIIWTSYIMYGIIICIVWAAISYSFVYLFIKSSNNNEEEEVNANNEEEISQPVFTRIK